ncbi:glycosyltransferase family 2 protein [Gimesia aquarii]|uniref:Glycosyltransferase CsbB n=1 Tax=Gimesia aquarii TaxID=2527964 RepID=A0A517X0E5_9PLAN|nr:glycosyltransferase family 2 protein [Gimesia aquarii]QDU10961.1 Putative glycosyltransferase CsbB [Gimesia aquarii]
MANPTYSLIIPVYKNESNIPDLLAALASLHKNMPHDLEVVFVIDGSPDRCYEILLKELKSYQFSSQLILLSRNFGSFSAIRAGLQAGIGEYFAVMAADLQEPPELVLQMWSELAKNTFDVVIAVREARNDPFLTKLPSSIFWGLYRRFVVPEVPPGGVDIFGCNQQFRDQLLQLEERHSSLIAQMFWVGFRRKFISYKRQERKHGKSAWTLSKKIHYLMDSTFAFTDLPIRLLIQVGGVTSGLSALFGLLVILFRMMNWIEVPGYTATIIAIIFFGAFNIFALGIVGSYAWRTYENTKSRPLHIVMQQHEFNHSRREL